MGYIKRKLAGKFTTTMEMIKMDDKRVRIITKGPKDMDTQINLDEEVEEVDPFDNKIRVMYHTYDLSRILHKCCVLIGR